MTASRRTPLLKGQHLLAIADVSPAEIEALLELAGKYVEVNRQIEKRHALRRAHHPAGAGVSCLGRLHDLDLEIASHRRQGCFDSVKL